MTGEQLLRKRYIDFGIQKAIKWTVNGPTLSMCNLWHRICFPSIHCGVFFSSCLLMHGSCLVRWASCWRGQLRHCAVLKIWRLALSLLMWCLWREWNAKNFEDCEIVMLEMKKMMFQSLCTWIVAWNSLPVSIFFFFFLSFALLFLHFRGYLCILGVC